METFNWSEPAELAAELIARGDLSLDAIAEQAKVARSTLRRWRQQPEFSARVAERLADFREEIRGMGLAVRERRVKALNDRHQRLYRVVEERAASPLMADVIGGTTGLIVHRVLKRIGKGDEAVSIESYDIDAALLREIREIERQAAVELGQWTEKTETNVLTAERAMALLSSVVEVIKRHVTDAETLRAISRDIGALVSSAPADGGRPS